MVLKILMALILAITVGILREKITDDPVP